LLALKTREVCNDAKKILGAGNMFCSGLGTRGGITILSNGQLIGRQGKGEGRLSTKGVCIIRAKRDSDCHREKRSVKMKSTSTSKTLWPPMNNICEKRDSPMYSCRVKK